MNGVAHIEIQFKYRTGVDVTQWFAVDAETLRQVESCLGKPNTERSPEDLRDWLKTHGGVLDRADGPAEVEVYPEGWRIEKWKRRGKLDRADAPALVVTWADGSRNEEWYRDGVFVKEEALLPISSVPGIKLHPPAPRP